MDPEAAKASDAPSASEHTLNKSLIGDNSAGAPVYPRHRGSLYRFMYDASAKDTHDGYSLGLTELGLPLLMAVLCEFIGMFIYQFLFIGVNSAGGDAFYLALAHGALYFFMVLCFGPVSGGHFNPVITIGAMVTGHTSVLRGILYIIVQIIGAVIAANMFLNSLSKNDAGAIGVCGYSDQLDNFNGGYMLVYFMMVFYFLLFLIHRVAMEPRHSSLFGPLTTTVLTGLSYAMVAYACIGFSSFGVYVTPNPAICTASYNGYTRTNTSDLNNSLGAIMSWVGALFAMLFFFATERIMKPHYNATAKEELTRNLHRIGQQKEEAKAI